MFPRYPPLSKAGGSSPVMHPYSGVPAHNRLVVFNYKLWNELNKNNCVLIIVI